MLRTSLPYYGKKYSTEGGEGTRVDTEPPFGGSFTSPGHHNARFSCNTKGETRPLHSIEHTGCTVLNCCSSKKEPPGVISCMSGSEPGGNVNQRDVNRFAILLKIMFRLTINNCYCSAEQLLSLIFFTLNL